MSKFAIYLDMDGVLADFGQGLENYKLEHIHELNQSSKNLSQELRDIKKRNYEAMAFTNFFLDLPIMEHAQDLWDLTKEYNPVILTAAPGFNGDHKAKWAAAACKQIWMDAAFGYINDKRFICTKSSNKKEYIHYKQGEYQILVDDRVSNCEAWEKEGGTAILYQNPEENIKELQKMLKK